MASDFMNYWEKRKVDLLENYNVDEKTMKLIFVEVILAWTKGKPLEGEDKVEVEIFLKELNSHSKSGLLGKFFS